VKQKVIAKIKKLLQLADASKNSDLEEATSAAAKAQALMEKHRIKKAMLHEEEPIGWRPLIDKGQPATWKLYLVTALTKNNGCYVVRSQDYEKDNQIHVVGEEADHETIQQLYTYIVNELNKLCILHLLDFRTELGEYPDIEYAKSFYLGAVTTVEERLKAACQNARQQELNKASTIQEKYAVTSALVVIDNKVDKAKDWVKNNLNAEIKNIGLDNTNSTGYSAGKAAGDQINLTPDRKTFE